MAETPKWVSHSAFSQWVKCGKQYELERVAKFPVAPAWYHLGGTAVHRTIERFETVGGQWAELDVELLWEQTFAEVIAEAEEAWPETDEWIIAGRPRRDGTRSGGYQDWLERGSNAVFAWLTWKAKHPELEIKFCEWEFTLPLGGEIFHGFIDIVARDVEKNSTVIIDIKTGTKRPANNHQLGIYKLAWEQSAEAALHPPVGVCGYWMAKDGELFEGNMAPYTQQVMGALARQYIQAVESGIFIPNVGADCFACTVRDACGMVSPGSALAAQYDSLFGSDGGMANG